MDIEAQPAADPVSRARFAALQAYIDKLRGQTVQVLKTSLADPFSKTLTVVLVLLGIGMSAALTATILRLVVPRSQVTVSAFQVLYSGKVSGAADGKALADFLVDDLQNLAEQTRMSGGNGFSSRKGWKPLSGQLEIPVSTSYGIEIKGVSLDEIIATWNRLRYKEYVVSGDLVGGSGGDSILVVRYSAPGAARSYQRTLKEVTPDSLRDAISSLSLELLEGVNPKAAFTYLTKVGNSCTTNCDAAWNDATQFCYGWLKSEPQNPTVLFDMGQVLESSHHPADALPFLKRAIALRPHDAFLLNEEGAVLSDLGRFDESDAAYEAEVRVHAVADPVLNLGVGALDRGQYLKAEEYFKRAFAIDSSDVGALLNLGHVYVKDGKYAEAGKAYSRALELDPGSDTAIYGIAHSFPRIGQLDEGLRQIDLFSRLNPASVFPRIYRGEALLLAGRLEEAKAQIQASIEVKNLLTAQRDMAILYFAEGDTKQATQLLQTLLNQFPNDIALHILKADFLEKAGDVKGSEAERDAADLLSPGARFDYPHWNE